MHEVLVNRLGGLSQPRKSVVRLTDRPDMTLDVYSGRKTTIQQPTTFLFPWLGWLVVLGLKPFETVFQSISGCLLEKRNDRREKKVQTTRTWGKRRRLLSYFYPN